MTEIFELDAQYVLGTYERYPVQLVSGDGVYVTDVNGKRYLDFLSGIGVNALGYKHPRVTQAIIEQANTGLLHTSNLFHNAWQAKLAQKLCDISGFDKAFIANTGTEAWEGALKLARLATKSKGQRILAMTNSFHGRTFGSLSTTGQAKYREPFKPLVPDVEFVNFNDVADLMRKCDESVAAICLETIQGEGGIVPVTPEFFRAARELANSVGAVLIADEIQCGLGRTGKWFAYQHYDVQPDIVTVAKPIAGGVPCAAILMTSQIAVAMKPGLHGTTFGGGPLACAVALATLESIDQDGLLKHAAELGAYIKDQLTQLQAKLDVISEIRVRGLMMGIELKSAAVAKATVSAMLDRGILINRTHETVLRFLPPYIIQREHVDTMLQALEAVLVSQSVAAEAVQHG